MRIDKLLNVLDREDKARQALHQVQSEKNEFISDNIVELIGLRVVRVTINRNQLQRLAYEQNELR